MLFVRQERRHAVTKTALATQDRRLTKHEEECAERYAEIGRESARGFTEVKNMLAEQNENTRTHREATALSLKEISDRFHSVDKAVGMIEAREAVRQERRT